MFNLNEKHLYPPNPHTGLFPPEKPRYTMTEEVEHTAREMKNTIQRLLNFEQRLKTEVDDLMKHLTSDNVIFKQTFSGAHTTFLQEVKNEVNAFERNVDATIQLFQNSISTDYATLSEDTKNQIAENLRTFEATVREFETAYESEFLTLKTNIQAQYNAFVNNVNERIDTNNSAFSEAFQDYQQKLTTNINLFEADVNARYNNFIKSINTTVDTFKTTWTQIVEQRLNTQDGKLSDAEMYMKTNLVATITSLIGDMHETGEFVEIIEGEVFNHLESRLTHKTVVEYGCVGDGETDNTINMQLAINDNYGKTLFIPDGVYIVNDLEIVDDITIIGTGKNAVLKYTGTGDCLHIKPITPTSTDDFIDIVLEDISIVGESGENAVYLSETTHSIFRNIYIEGFHTGFKMDGEGLVSKQNTIFNNHFEEIVIDRVTYGFDIFGCISDTHFDKLSISNCEYGFYIHGTKETQGSNNVTLTNSTFVYAKDCVHLENVHMRNLFINGGNFEQFDNHGIFIDPAECDFKVFTLCNSLFLPSKNANENTVCVELKKCSGGTITNILFQNNNADVVGIDTTSSMLLYVNNLIANNGSTIKHNISKACYHTTYEYLNNKDNLVFNTAIRSPRVTTDGLMLTDGEGFDTLNVVNGNLLFTKDGKNGYLNALMSDTVIKGLNNVKSGTCIFDDTLGKPVWYTGSKWVDATGTEV